jgi:hypothetical protein
MIDFGGMAYTNPNELGRLILINLNHLVILTTKSKLNHNFSNFLFEENK